MAESLGLALAWWRATRDPGLAYLVEVFGALAGAPAVAGEWYDRLDAATDADVTPLLASLCDTGNGEVAQARLTAIVERGPDPRVASALIAWIRAARYRNTGVFWMLVFDTLGRWAPASFDRIALADEVLRAEQTNFAITTSNRLRRLKITSPAPTPLTAEQRAVVDGWLAAHPRPVAKGVPGPPASGVSVDELLALVAEEPDADAPREVLADYWLERGDPRGRFVRLQLDRARREAGEPNLRSEWAPEEEQLQRAHGAAWFGPWVGAMGLLSCERGFPHDVRLYRRLKQLSKLRGAPWLATVRDLFIGSTVARSALPFLAHPVTRGVHTLRHVDPERARAVLEACPQVEEMWFSLGPRDDDDAAAMNEHPDRRYVVGEAGDIGRFRVRDLAVQTHARGDFDLLTLVDRAAPEVQRLELQSGEGVALERAGGGWRARLTPMWGFHGNPVPTSVALLRRLLARGDVEPPAGPALAGAHYRVAGEDDVALLRDLPPAPWVLAEPVPRAAVPADAELWGDAAMLWREAPQVSRFCQVGGTAPPAFRLERRPDGRADVRATGYGLPALDPLVGQIARVTGWGAAIEGWCAERGIPFEPC